MNKILFLLLSLFLFPPILNAQTVTYSGTNIGIGSINPGQVLDVQGTVQATGFTVKGYGGFTGSWVTRSATTVYQASTDGFFVGYTASTSSGNCDIHLYTDSSNPPTTFITGNGEIGNVNGAALGAGTVVRKNDYYEATLGASCTGTNLYFIPFGS